MQLDSVIDEFPTVEGGFILSLFVPTLVSLHPPRAADRFVFHSDVGQLEHRVTLSEKFFGRIPSRNFDSTFTLQVLTNLYVYIYMGYHIVQITVLS